MSQRNTPVPSAGSGNVIATYKDGTVTEHEFLKYMAFVGLMNPDYANTLDTSPYKKMTLKQYIGHKVLYSLLGEISDEAIKKVDAQMNMFVEHLKRAIESDPTLKMQIEEAALSDSDIKYFYRLITTVTDAELNKISDDAAKMRFEETSADFNMVTVRHILISTIDKSSGEELDSMEEAFKRAQEVKMKLDAGGDWSVLAKEYSDDIASSNSGGLYRRQTVGNYIKNFKDAVNKQEIGQIGDPVKTEYGYHVIQVEKREEMTFDMLDQNQKFTIKQTLASEGLEKFMADELEGLIIKIDLPKDTTI
ncbi:peptidylprolyl isomerase [Paenibacillus methanolicus]|uniref:Foldase protein PrsA n=1 Tax=Paenibacillus methanolicus TaxID=582686 RepID=A0A5S5CJ04_9BACL|nr:peptidylprolyl isomerase [Paenibacillus methanolicus]TYP78897.1 foldase protein PrsA [Paenibacillus methanolicus]